MKIGILGSGTVAQTIAAKLAQVGQDVMIGARSPEKLKDWLAQNPKVKVGSLQAAAVHGEILFNAVKGDATLEVLKTAGEHNLKGKILVDISNPVDLSKGMPPSLFISNTDSLGEQVQRAFPETKVIKSFNTLIAPLMVEPRRLAGGDHTLFLSGNDTEAKTRVTALFKEWFGWRDILDVGDITTARGTEAVLLLWAFLATKLGTGNLQFKIVR